MNLELKKYFNATLLLAVIACIFIMHNIEVLPTLPVEKRADSLFNLSVLISLYVLVIFIDSDNNVDKIA